MEKRSKIRKSILRGRRLIWKEKEERKERRAGESKGEGKQGKKKVKGRKGRAIA
jgi:hypothetical protein